MSYLNVSGLSPSGEDDAMKRLMGITSSQGNEPSGKNPFLEAMMKVSTGFLAGEGEEDAEGTMAKAHKDTSASKETAAKTRDIRTNHCKLPPRAASTGAAAAAGATTAPRRTVPAMPSRSASESAVLNARATPPSSAAPPADKLAPAAKVDMTELQQEVSSFQADNPTDTDSLAPLPELVHLKLRRPLTETLKVTSLTRVQKLSWAAMIDRSRDVLVRSETGSGKTLAYALPIFHELLADCDTHPVSRDVGTLIIIMCPTRELVLQVTDTTSSLLRCAQFLTVGGIHGGENRHKEKARLRKGLAVLVTTPGRLLDHLKTTASFNVANVRTLVMDEADRLLDLGFEKPIREIMALLEQRCTQASAVKRVLVSATITDGVERLTHFALRRNVSRIGETQDTFSIPATLRQHYVTVPTKHRLAVLISFLRSQFDAGANKIVVFVSTADSTEFLYYLLSRLQSPFTKKGNPFMDGTRETRRAQPGSGRSAKKMTEMANQHVYGENEEVVTFDDDDDDDDDDERAGTSIHQAAKKSLLDVNVFKLHGNMSQVDRASVFHTFKYGNPKALNQRGVLFCTDVAARGLDMPLIDWIVHYDPPSDPPSYIHRVGRTARIGRSGDSILFLAPHEIGYANYLMQFVQNQDSRNGQAPDNSSGAFAIHTMEEKKCETFLFYLTKLDPNSNHMWVQSTAVLERAICRLVMRDDTSDNGYRRHSGKGSSSNHDHDVEEKRDNLTRIALFAYQSYIRAYAGLPKKLKSRFFSSTELHLGHVAQSFGIDKSPGEVQKKLQGYIREDRLLARDNRKGTVDTRSFPSAGRRGGNNFNKRYRGAEDGDDVVEAYGDEADMTKKRKRQRVELDHDERYHSMLAQKQRKLTRDYIEKRREMGNSIKPFQFSEFDA